jgi:hypothetical protein
MKKSYVIIFVMSIVVLAFVSANASASVRIKPTAEYLVKKISEKMKIEKDTFSFTINSQRIVNEESFGYLDDSPRKYFVKFYLKHDSVCGFSIIGHWDKRGYDFMLSLKGDTLSTVSLCRYLEDDAMLKVDFEKKYGWANPPIIYDDGVMQVVFFSQAFKYYLWRTATDDLEEYLSKLLNK